MGTCTINWKIFVCKIIQLHPTLQSCPGGVVGLQLLSLISQLGNHVHHWALPRPSFSASHFTTSFASLLFSSPCKSTYLDWRLCFVSGHLPRLLYNQLPQHHRS